MPLTLTQLQKIGLTAAQAKIYKALLGDTSLTAQELGKKCGIQRTNIYHILDPMIADNLVAPAEHYGRGHYQLTDPQNLRNFVLKKQVEAHESTLELESAFPLLTSEFTLSREAPSVRTYEGLEGLKQVYTEMLNSGTKTLCLFRSVSDSVTPEIHALVRWVREEQVKRDIRTMAITQDHPGAKKNFLSGRDLETLVLRRVVPGSLLDNPAQITLWNNTVAISSLEGTLITTVIENEMIAQTFENIFKYCWKMAEKEHLEIVARWKTEYE